ncbi:MAG: hypothetical protein RI894_2257, partial [Bacteroidota bacterium]
KSEIILCGLKSKITLCGLKSTKKGKKQRFHQKN